MRPTCGLLLTRGGHRHPWRRGPARRRTAHDPGRGKPRLVLGPHGTYSSVAAPNPMEPDPGPPHKAVLRISRHGARHMRQEGRPRPGGARGGCLCGGKRPRGICAARARTRPRGLPRILSGRQLPFIGLCLRPGRRGGGSGRGCLAPRPLIRATGSPPGRAGGAAGPGREPASGVLGLYDIDPHGDRLRGRRIPAGGPPAGPLVDSRLARWLALVPQFRRTTERPGRPSGAEAHSSPPTPPPP